MIRIETKRLIIKSNLCASKGQLIYPPKQQEGTSLLNLRPLATEDTGFAIYLKPDESAPIAHIGFRDDRRNYELTYGTEDAYRRHGYLYEALSAFLHWFFADIGVEIIYGLIGNNNIPSINLALKVGFQPCGQDGNCTWYELKNPMSHEEQDLGPV